MKRILKTLLLILSLGVALVMLSPLQIGAAAPIAEADTDAFLNANFSLQNTYNRVLCVSNSSSCPAQITTTVPCLTNPCTKPSTAYLIHSKYTTIQAASNAAVAGDLVIIMPGTYRGLMIDGGAGGADNAYIHFRGWGPPGTVIVNDDQNDSDSWLKDNFYFVDTDHYIIQNIAFTAAERAGIFITGFFSDTGHFAHHFIVLDVYSHHNNTWGLHTTSTNYVVIQDSFFTHSAVEHGAYISGSGDHMVIRRNVFQNNNASGLQINADPQTAAIEIFYYLQGTTGNTCGITAAQIDWDGSATWQQIHNCYVSQGLPNLGDAYEDGISKNIIVEQNVMTANGTAGGAAINLASVRDSNIRNNLVYGNSAGGIACWDNAYVDDKGVTTFGCNNVNIFNNTLVDNVGSRGSMILMNYATNMDVVNNVIVRPRSDAYDIVNHSASGLFSGRNYYYAMEISADSTGATQLDTAGGSGSITGFTVANALTQFAYASFTPWINTSGAWPVLNNCRPDYRPLPASPITTGGSDPHSPAADRDGEPRSGTEIGAYRAATGPRTACITGADVGPLLTVDAAAPTKPISPYIYGMNWADSTLLNELDLPVNRFGGNAVSRYNYQNDVSNHGADWYYENVKESNASSMPNDSFANRFIEANNSAGADTILTVPMTGYVSNNNYGPTGCGYRISLYGAQQSNDSQWRPDCGNGVWTNGTNVTGNNPADTSLAITQAFVAGWVDFLEGRYGAASTTNGVRFYALDNEPDLWFETHRDVHPAGASYDELYTRGAQYAAAIKAADPTAQVLGPVSWGWWGYFYSAKDVQDGGAAWWNTRPDRMAHGDMPFLEWYLAQMRAYEIANGIRILDYLDIHYYPQNGVALNTAGDATRQANRLMSTRSLWDPTYEDGSWVDEPVYLIPRMRSIINARYPNTKLAITEYNWGGLEHINGALAQADILGIFGREGVDLATIWDGPTATQPGAYAFRMYLNYDGAGGRFGNTSVQSSSTNQDVLSIYASRDGAAGALKLMIINKSATDSASTVAINGFCPAATANVYRYSSANLNAIVASTQAVSATGFNGTFPANSITLVVIPVGTCGATPTPTTPAPTTPAPTTPAPTTPAPTTPAGNVLGAGLHQQDHAGITYTGTWQQLNDPGANGGSFRRSNDPNAQATFSFTGSSFTLITLKFSNRGSMEVCIDTTNCSTVNVNSPSLIWQHPVVFNVTSGTHSVRIRNLSSAYIDIDAIQVAASSTATPTTPAPTTPAPTTPAPTTPAGNVLGAGLHQQDHAGITYTGTWQLINDAGANGGSFRRSNDPNAQATFSFTGSSFTLITLKFSNRGSMEVCIDTTNCSTINVNSPTLVWQHPVVFNVTSGTHSVRIRNLSSAYIDIDAIQVAASSTATPTTPAPTTPAPTTPAPTTPAGNVLGVGTHQQDHAGITYTGTWQLINDAGANGGSFRRTNDPNAQATFSFTGSSFTLITLKFSNRGSMEVCIDTTNCSTVNVNSPSLIWQHPVVFNVTSGTHSVRIRNLSSAYIDIDAIQVAASSTATPTTPAPTTPAPTTPAPTTPAGNVLGVGTHQQDHAGITYTGTWQLINDAGANGGSFRRTNDPNAQATFSFTGSSFTLITLKFSNRGSMEVCIDTTNCSTINVNSPTLVWQHPMPFNVTSGTHSVRIRNLSSAYIDIDAIQVSNSATATPTTPAPTTPAPTTPAPTTPAGNVLGVGTHQQDHAGITYTGTWQQLNDGGANGDSFRRTNDPNAQATFSFTGSSFTLITLKFSNRGSMEVCIDTTNCSTVNVNSSTLVWQHPVVFNVTSGTHTVRIRNLSSAYIDIDAIQVSASAATPTPTPTNTPGTVFQPGTYQQDHAGITYTGIWQQINDAGSHGGSFRRTNDPNAQATFQFNGASFTLIAVKFTNRGPMEICIDTTNCSTVDMNSPTLMWQYPVTYNTTSGTHSVRIRNLSSAYIDIDAIQVSATPATVTPTPTPTPTPPPPPTLSQQTIASGMASPTTFAMAPDGRIFVLLQGGNVRIVKDGALLATPFLTLSVNSSGERGLLGIAFDPNFASNQYVYLYYTTSTTPIHNRVIRVTANGDVADTSTIIELLNLENLSATNHNGGAIHFGADGKLYVAVGENAVSSNAQTLNNRLGKILRINADGTIPTDNPFYATATGDNRAIWALGLRNPYTFAFQPGTGRMFINDVGQSTWEEINDGIAGSNYGWPATEGVTSNPSYRSPLHAYNHGLGCAISGGAFYNPTTVMFPSEFVGDYFFADYCGGWIRSFDPATGEVRIIRTGLGNLVDLLVAPDGSLYYLTRTGGTLGRLYVP